VAANIGFADLDEGRFRDVADGDLDAVIGGLGRRAAARTHRADR
jgi:antitoxin ParD1/3/4